MDDILKGNFKTKQPVANSGASEPESLETRFEREALKRLGGSIAFVKKQKVHWGEEDLSDDKPDDSNPV